MTVKQRDADMNKLKLMTNDMENDVAEVKRLREELDYLKAKADTADKNEQSFEKSRRKLEEMEAMKKQIKELEKQNSAYAMQLADSQDKSNRLRQNLNEMKDKCNTCRNDE